MGPRFGQQDGMNLRIGALDELTRVGVHRGDGHVGVGRAGYAEIDDFHATVGVDEDVAGFQVTMDDALLVAVMDRVAAVGEDA